MITNAARHEPEAVAALRAGRDDTVNRLLRLPLPEPYVPTRLESVRDRLRNRSGNPKPKAKPKPKPQAKSEQARKPGKDRPVRRSGHQGGRQRQPGQRARSLEGQRYR